MPSRNDQTAPLSDASDSDINRLVDDVLRTGKHLAVPVESQNPQPERYHARAIAEQMQRLAQQLSPSAASTDSRDDRDEWWFEVDDKRIGPLSLRKIRFLWEDGELTPDSLCWHQGFPKWVSLFRVSELAGALTPQLHVDVEQAARAFAKSQSAEWASPAGDAMAASNRRRLESSQRLGALPLSTAVNAGDEHAGTYTALRPNEPAPRPTPERSGLGQAIVSGVVAGAIASATLVAMRVLWPLPDAQPPAIDSAPIALPSGAPAVPPPEPAKLTERLAVASTPVAPAGAPAPEAKPAGTPQVPAPPPPEPPRPATLDEAFARTFAEKPTDELTTGELTEVVRAHHAQVGVCLDVLRAATPDAKGNLAMRWTVEADGHVTGPAPASGATPNAGLADCLAKEIATWTFPRHAVAHPAAEFSFDY